MRTVPMLLKSVALAAALYAGSASAAFYVGDTTGSDTFNRPFTLDALSAEGTDVAFDAFSFGVEAAGLYTFRSRALPLREPWDNFLALYAGSFDPSDALSNLVVLNDDFNGNTGRAGFDHVLETGTAYTLVTTGFGNSDFGRYINTIRGPGDLVAPPVPEPGTYALMLGGLALVSFIARRRAR